MEHLRKLSSDIPRIAPPRLHARKPSRSPTRNRLGDDLLADLSPATTLEAFTNPSGKLRASIEAATETERAFGLRAALASKKIQEWVTELSEWPWPAEGGSVGFQTSAPAIRWKLTSFAPDSHNTPDYFAGYNEEEPRYIGGLLAAEVERYEARVEEITDEMDDLNVEDIKRQVLDTHFSPRSRPSSSSSVAPPMPSLFASYTRMDDFTAVVTATVLQALPNLSRLMRLMDVWTIRLRILRRVPLLLRSLDDAETAMRSGWNVLGSPITDGKDLPEEEIVSRHTFSAMMDVLSRKVTDLGKDLDFMLDTLEGKEDTLPNEWLDRMDLIEKDYGEWTVAGDRKVWEGEWAIAEKKKREKKEARKLKEAQLAELQAEHDALEQARLKALRDAEVAEAACLDAITKDLARIEAEKEVSRLESLRLEKMAENARIEAERKAQNLARQQAKEHALEMSIIKAAKEAEIAEAGKLEAARVEIALVEAKQKAQAEAISRAAEERALELFRLEALSIAELARIEEEQLEAQRRAAEVEASEMARLEALRIAEIAKAETTRIEAEKAAQALANRKAEEEEITRLEMLKEAEIVEAAKIEDERRAHDLALQRAKEEAEVLESHRLEALMEAESIKLKAEHKIQALAARNQSDAVTESARINGLQTAEDAEAARILAQQEIEETAQRKTEIENAEMAKVGLEDKALNAALPQEKARLLELDTVTNLRDTHNARHRASNVIKDFGQNARDEEDTAISQVDGYFPEADTASQTLRNDLEESSNNEWPGQHNTVVSVDNVKQQLNAESTVNNLIFTRRPVSPPNRSVPATPVGVVQSTVAVGLGISALAFLHKSEQEKGSPSSTVDSKDSKIHLRGYSELDGANDGTFDVLDDPSYNASRISHRSLEIPQEMIVDSGISSPIRFDAVEPQTPVLGSPIHFGGHFDAHRDMSPKPSFSSQTQRSCSPTLETEAQPSIPTTPIYLKLSDSSPWSENANSHLLPSSGRPSMPKSLTSYDGAADIYDTTTSSSSAGTEWVVIDSSDADEYGDAARTTLVQDSDLFDHSAVSSASRTLPRSTMQDEDTSTLVTPTKYSHLLLEPSRQAEDEPNLLSPVLEEELMPSIEIDFLDGACEACDSYARSCDEDSPPARKRTISVGRFDTELRTFPRTHGDSISSNTSTVMDARASEYTSSRVGTPQVETSFLDSLPEDFEQSPSADRFARARKFFEYSPPPSPSATPRLAKQRSLQVLRTPGYGFGDFSAPRTPLDAPALDNVNVMATPMATISRSPSGNDQLQQQISSLLETMPAHIRLSSGQDSTPSTTQASRLKKTRRSVTPSARPSSSMSNYSTSSRAATPSFTLAPVFSKTTQRSRGSIGNPEIKLYHLSRSTGEPPIKLFVRLVGERGERVMVRVGGGWADLGEYLKEYASHHGRRSTLEGGEKIEIQDLPSRIASGSSITSTMRSTGRASSLSRPASGMGNRPVTAMGHHPATNMSARPGSSLEVRKTGRSVSTTDNTKLPSRVSEDKIPATPQPVARTRVFQTPPSAASVASSVHSGASEHAWAGEEASLGLAGPKAKKIVISERDREWVDSMKEKVKLASAEKERRTRERERLDREHMEREQERRTSFGDIGRVGGTKRLFPKSAGEKMGRGDERGRHGGF